MSSTTPSTTHTSSTKRKRPPPRTSTHAFKKPRPSTSASTSNSPEPSFHASKPNSNKRTKKTRQNNPSTRIHSLRRQLQTATTLPPPLRIEKERELATLLRQREQQRSSSNKQHGATARTNPHPPKTGDPSKGRTKAEHALISKYHFTRFLERKKATKQLKNFERELAALENSEDDMHAATRTQRRKETQAQIDTARVCLAYTRYAPLGEKYVSLFPGSEDKNVKEPPAGSEDEESGDVGATTSKQRRLDSTEFPAMWYRVKEAMEQGQEALEALRDGSKVGAVVDDQTGESDGDEEGSAVVLQKSADEDDDDDLSDGGFFE